MIILQGITSFETRKDVLAKSLMVSDSGDSDQPILVDVIHKAMNSSSSSSSSSSSNNTANNNNNSSSPTSSLKQSSPSPPKQLSINTNLDTLSSSYEDVPSPLKNRSKSSSPKASSSPTPLSPLNIDVASSLSSSKNSPSPTNNKSPITSSNVSLDNGPQRSPSSPSSIPRYSGVVDLHNLPSLPQSSIRRGLDPLPQVKDKSYNIKSGNVSDGDLDASGDLSDVNEQSHEFEQSAKSIGSLKELENSNRSIGSLKELETSARSLNSLKDPLESSISSDRSLGSLKNLKEIEGLKPLGALRKSKLAPIESATTTTTSKIEQQPKSENTASDKVILEESKNDTLQTALNPINRSKQMRIESKKDDEEDNDVVGVSVTKASSGITRSSRGWNSTDNNDNDVFNDDNDDDNLKPKDSPISKQVNDWNERSLDSSNRSFQSEDVIDDNSKSFTSKDAPIVKKEFAVETKSKIDTKPTVDDDDDYGDEDFEEEIEEIDEEIDDDVDISTGDKSDDSSNPYGFNDKTSPPKKLFEKKDEGPTMSRQKSGMLDLKKSDNEKKIVSKIDTNTNMEDFDESVASNDSDNFEFSVGASENSVSRDGSFSFLNESGGKDNKNSNMNRKNSPKNSLLTESTEFEYSVTEQELSNSDFISDYDYTTTNLGPKKK